MARPRIHDQAAGETLLDSAVTLLRSGGPGAVSVRAVADASDLSFRAVYAVFGSKQALIDALAERGYRSLSDRVRGVPSTRDPARDLVAAGAEAFRGFALEEPEIFRLTFEQVSAEVLQHRQVARAAYASYEALGTKVRRAREAGLVHADRSDEVCILEFHSLCQGLASAELAAQPPPSGPGFWPMVRGVDLAAVWRDALGSLVEGFASPPEVAQ
jgi:AcrR family transcriptional regulator